jgi:hypothetical protein
MKKRTRPKKSPKADLIPVSLLDKCPDDPGYAVGWIQGRAAALADCYAGTYRRSMEFNALVDRFARAAGKTNLEWMHSEASGSTGGNAVLFNQQLNQYRDHVRTLYDAVLTFMPDWADLEFRKHCQNYHVAENDPDAATKQWERLELEASKRIHAARRGFGSVERGGPGQQATVAPAAQSDPGKEGKTMSRKTKVLNLNAPTESEADEELPAAGTVTPVLTPNGTLFRFDRHPELLQAEWQAELFESLWRILLHMRAWGRPEYTAENLGTVETENFRDILRYGTSGLFNYVESLKSAILDAGLGVWMKDDWLAFLVGGFDLVKGLSADSSASIGRMMDAMYPLMLKLRAEARVAQDLAEKGAAVAQAGQPGESTGTTPQADVKEQPLAGDGSPFYKPAYFQKWKISDELLRRNTTDGKAFKESKVRRRNIMPSNSTIKLSANRTAKPRTGKRVGTKGKPRPVYWYSEPDARKRWPEKFSVVEKQPPKT